MSNDEWGFDDDPRTIEEILAEIRVLTNADHYEQVERPRTIAKYRFILNNRTSYPYRDGKSDLEEYITFFEEWTKSGSDTERFYELSHRLRDYGILPDEIAIHAKRLSEELLNGPITPKVIAFSKEKISDVVTGGDDPKK